MNSEPEKIKTEFIDSQYDSAYPLGIEHHYWNQARSAIIASTLVRHGLEKKKMLEIGCGRGLVVEYLRAKGYDCRGVELAPVALERELEEYIQTGMDFAHLSREVTESIEVVLLFDVLEHILEAESFLRKIRETFPNAQHLVVTVPARMELWSNYDEHYGHYVRYTLPSLEKVTLSSGYETLYGRYFFHLLYIPAVLLSLLGIKRSVVVKSPRGFERIVHRVIAWIFRAERCVVPGRFMGTSIIMVAKKSTEYAHENT